MLFMFKIVVAKANSDCTRYLTREIHVSLVSYFLSLNKKLYWHTVVIWPQWLDCLTSAKSFPRTHGKYLALWEDGKILVLSPTSLVLRERGHLVHCPCFSPRLAYSVPIFSSVISCPKFLQKWPRIMEKVGI